MEQVNINRTYDSVVAAKYMLWLANQQGSVLNVTKVQKMLFILYGYFLAKDGITILSEEPKAWPFGPVFPRSQKRVDYNKIPSIEDSELQGIKNDAEVTAVMNRIISKYSSFSATQLSNWSHAEGSPWDKTTKQPGFVWSTPIPREYIADYFKSVSVV